MQSVVDELLTKSVHTSHTANDECMVLCSSRSKLAYYSFVYSSLEVSLKVCILFVRVFFLKAVFLFGLGTDLMSFIQLWKRSKPQVSLRNRSSYKPTPLVPPEAEASQLLLLTANYSLILAT